MTPAVAVHAAGGAEIGAGHLSRTRTLARALVADGVRVHVVAEAPAELAAGIAGDGVALACAPDRARARDRLRAAAAAGATGLVTDLPGLGAGDARWARQEGFAPLVHLCDDGADAYPADLFVNGDVAMPAGVAALAPRGLVGPRYHVVRPEVVARRPSAPWAGARVERVLVTPGAADPGGVTETVLPGLVEQDVAVTVALGPALGDARGAGLERRWGSRVELVRPADLPGLLVAADLVVTMPGLTAYEALCLGRPVLAVGWGRLRPYAEALHRAGCAARADVEDPDTLSAAALGAVIADVEGLARRAARGHEVVDGGGAGRVAAAIGEELR